MRAGNVLSYLANDHLGSTAFIMDSGGALATHLRYYAYGMTWSQSGSSPATDLLFTGHRRMGSKSGTYYANARFYGADNGRFLQPDSFMPGMPQPQDLNRYSYVANNPITFRDPTGHYSDAPIVIDFSNWNLQFPALLTTVIGPHGTPDHPLYYVCVPNWPCFYQLDYPVGIPCTSYALPGTNAFVCRGPWRGQNGQIDLLDSIFDVLGDSANDWLDTLGAALSDPYCVGWGIAAVGLGTITLASVLSGGEFIEVGLTLTILSAEQAGEACSDAIAEH